jgi:3-isopropylmalate/(R)-2-methylmalate dehydratase small subunit
LWQRFHARRIDDLKGTSSIDGSAVCLLRDNIDTDAIIPSREIKSVSKSGLGPGLFAAWRYLDVRKRELNPDFILNLEKYQGAKILITGSNFGCGSSREHAVWALQENGFAAIIAPSFGRIFFDNCICNGLLPVTLQTESILKIAGQIDQGSAASVVRIDLPRQVVTGPDGSSYSFDISDANKEIILSGLDQINVTEKYRTEITAFRQRDEAARPWAYL